MESKLFTIVTVCYNAEKDIEQTIQSVIRQTYQNFEYLIIDGKSKDSTISIIEKYLDEDNIFLLSETDNGIYDAMNKAIRIAHGEMVYFLNAGDTFYSDETLENIRMELVNFDADIYYGNILWEDRDGKSELRLYKDVCSKKWYFLSGDMICHQSIFARRSLFNNNYFDTSFKICADKNWLLQCIKGKGRLHPVNIVIAKVPREGFSSANIRIFEDETDICIRKHLKKLHWIYTIIYYIKKSKIGKMILNTAGNILFTGENNEK